MSYLFSIYIYLSNKVQNHSIKVIDDISVLLNLHLLRKTFHGGLSCTLHAGYHR